MRYMPAYFPEISDYILIYIFQQMVNQSGNWLRFFLKMTKYVYYIYLTSYFARFGNVSFGLYEKGIQRIIQKICFTPNTNKLDWAAILCRWAIKLMLLTLFDPCFIPLQHMEGKLSWLARYAAPLLSSDSFLISF